MPSMEAWQARLEVSQWWRREEAEKFAVAVCGKRGSMLARRCSAQGTAVRASSACPSPAAFAARSRAAPRTALHAGKEAHVAGSSARTGMLKSPAAHGPVPSASLHASSSVLFSASSPPCLCAR